MKNSNMMMLMAIFAALVVSFSATAGATDAERMTKEELRSMLGNPDVIIVDVRQPGDYNPSDTKIQGAVREDPGAVGAWMDKYPKDKILVFYCD
jgi:3-mercaptopyruvate sulfurtransferase SseA